MMNIFRLLGDLSHVVSIFILLLRLFTTRQAAGISLKTQEVSACGTLHAPLRSIDAEMRSR